MLIVALIGAFGIGGNILLDGVSPLKNPGEISNAHARVIADGSCVSCHDVHGASASTAIKAIFNPSGPTSKGANNKCMECHELPLLNVSVHNSQNCSTCHTEHKGGIKPPSKISDAQCHSCHDNKFTNFGASHPSFGKTYPYDRRTGINFDHNAHLGNHFKNPQYVKLVPQGKCIACHEVSTASQAVPIKPFEEVCASCHQDEIKSRSLTLFQMPELEKNPNFGAELFEACGVKMEVVEAGEDFEAVSVEELNPIMAFLLEVDGSDGGAYGDTVSKFISSAVNSNLAVFEGPLKEFDGKSDELLTGLSPKLLKDAFCAWVANKEYEPIAEAKFGGWSADEFSIRYNASKHQDRVLVNWLNFTALNDEEILSSAILNKEGPGSCVKCHSVSETDEVRVEWKAASGSSEPSHHKYSHAPHLNVLGPGSQCGTCHKLNAKSSYAETYKQRDPLVFESSFEAIKQGTCKDCHNEGQVVQNCLTCHEYHKVTGFKAKMVLKAVKKSGLTLASRDGKR
tara:strand:+ start:542 stop:2077 length:1536 start_codon:yes stop_codon:yes gene_type:complete